jgi:hypothetical protein
VVSLAVARSSLPFLVAGHHLVLPTSAARLSDKVPRVAMLLPPARHQPVLHANLLRQALLSLRCCSELEPAVWIDPLQRERLLLPAPLSLLAHSPWREAGLAALPPVDPLWEVLWLLVQQEQREAEWVEELVAGVRERGELVGDCGRAPRQAGSAARSRLAVLTEPAGGSIC